ncbi:MAG: hypothetical protein RIQ93_1515 [Verrucomicrobiota bacterium]|jgi:hypothetical protein
MLCAVGCCGASVEFAAAREAWPQFRGANGSGIAADANPPLEFGPTEAVRWSVPIPWSPSSPVVWDDRIFLTTFHDGQLEVRCHDRTDGNLRWARPIKAEQIEDHHRLDGSPAASTPATDGTLVVSYFGSFGLICHDLAGVEQWRQPMPVALSVGQYGSGTSPIIVGQTVLLARDQFRYSALLAFDLKSGRKLWEAPRPEVSGSFGTPAYWRNDGVDEVVLAATGHLKGYEVKTGVERWSVGGITGTICTSPVAGEGLIFFAGFSNHVVDTSSPSWDEFRKRYDTNGDGEVAHEEIPLERRDYWRGLDRNRDGKFTQEDWGIGKAQAVHFENVLVAVKPGGRGDVSDTHVVWKFRRALPYVPSPLIYEGRIYFVKDGGIISSLDVHTGDPFYAQERIPANGNYYASPVAAAGRIYVTSLPGKITVLKAGGTKPEVLHVADFGVRILATPAIVGESLYVRTATHLWAFGK